MKEKLNVAVIASWYPGRVRPHLGTFVRKQAEAVSPFAAVSALFVCADNTTQKKYEIISNELNRVYTVNVYYRNTGNPLSKAWRYFTAHRMGWKHICDKKGKPDLVHLNILWPAGLFVWYLHKFSGIRYVITENWTGYLDSDGSYKKSSAVKKFLTKIIAQKAKIITPVSMDLKRAMALHDLGTRFEIVYNVVDTSLFSPPSAPPINAKTLFLHVSTTLDEQKNVSGILEAVKMLSERRNDFELRIVSESDFSAHAKTAERLGILNNYVVFENAKQTAGVAEEMKKAHCFVLFSNYENLPLVILEAMACGLPVISSTAGGVPEHINKAFGILVHPRDTPALCNAMEEMIKTKSNYDSKKIREYAVTNFSYEAVGKQFLSVYQTAAEKNG